MGLRVGPKVLADSNNKISIIRSSTGIILGTQLFHNEYDVQTIEASLAQVERLTQRKIKILAGDRGYRGKKEVNGTQILILDASKPSDSRYQKRKKHKLFSKRAGIEPTIGHLKSWGCSEPTIGSGCLQLQKSYESSFVSVQNNKRNTKREVIDESIPA